MVNHGIGTWVHRRRVKSSHTVAIIAGDRRLTYPELAERIDRVSTLLAARGVSSGDRVAYLGPNAPEFLETLFGCGQLGAILVPLNTRLTAEELAFQLTDAGAVLAIVDAELAHLVPADLPRLTVGAAGASYEPALMASEPVHREAAVQLGDPAVILYTSGTTGHPKGAVLTHGNLTWNSFNVLVDYDVTSRDVALILSPLFHAASLGMGALPTLLKGGTLVLQPRFEAGAVLRAIEEHRITSLSGVPTTFQFLVDHPDWATTDVSSITKLTCGGSAIAARVAAAFEERGLAFSSGYGLTEASPGATSLSTYHAPRKPTTSGLPHFFTHCRVADAAGRDCAPGEVGEILLAGPNVIPGYWQRPDASAEAIDKGWLRTGDLGFLDDEGFLTITDRAKDMFISGGENVYSAEVERAILDLPGVEAVALIGIPDERWGEVGRAVIVAAPGAHLTHEAVVAHLTGRLAKYKIPASTIVVEALPLTASGKVRKHEVRKQYGEDAPTS
jgi:fatty-acyl-CoA synthase